MFSPSPEVSIKLKQQESTLSFIALAEEAKLLFLAAGSEGIIVVDGNTNLEINSILEFGSVDILSVDKKGKYLFFSYQEQISAFEIQISQKQYNLKLLSQDQTQRGSSIRYLLLFNNDQWAAGISDSTLVVYDISKASLNVIGQLDFHTISYPQIKVIDTYLVIFGAYLKIIKFHFDPISSYLKLFIVLESPADYAFSSASITSDKKFIYGLDTWGGFSFSLLPDIDAVAEGEKITEFVFDIKNWWPNSDQTPLPNEIVLTKDENFALVGVQQLGIFIFDISDRSKENVYPKLFQWIRSSGYSYSIILSNDESNLYYANGLSFEGFSKVDPNFNLDYPNLFNEIQANFTVIGTNIYRWRCYITSQGKYMIGTFDKSGLFFFDMENDPLQMQLVQNIVPENIYFTESAIIDEENGYVITPGNSIDTLLFVYSFPITTNQPIASLVYGDGIWAEGICYNRQKTMIGVAGYSLLVLVDSRKGLMELQVYSELSLSFEVVELLFSNDSNYLLGVARNYGIVCFDISDPTSIKLIKTLKTTGGFSIIGSQSGIYAFVGEGPKGIGIVDMNQLPNIVFISRIEIEGTTFHITPIKSDSFLLISSNVVGFLSVVDIRDKKNLQIVQKFKINKQNGLASCVSPDESFAFLTNYSGVTSIPLVSDLLIHTQLYQILGKETSKIVFQFKSPSTTLLVGQNYQMQFYLLYPQLGTSLTNIYYYDNFEVVSLPFWMNMNSQLSSLDIQVDKMALSNDLTTSSLNTIILQYKTPLPADSFLFNGSEGVTTTKEQSELIHRGLRSMNLLDFQNLLILANFERSESFYFKSNNSFLSDASQILLNKVKKTLQKSVTYNPVMFKASSSLKFYESPTTVPIDQGGDGISQYFLFSIQSSVQLYLQTKEGVGKFVNTYYEGVIAQISNFDTYLKLEGSVKNINNILKNRVLFFQIAQNLSDINFHLIIVDGINYIIEKDILLQDASQFIKLKQNMQIKSEKQLQNQFNTLFSGGSINIEESFSFEFSKDTFINPDTQTITYTAYFMNEGEYVESLPGAWIQQSSNSLRFFGQAPVSQYRTILRIKIEASDGYTSISDEFSLYVYGVPFVFLISTAVKIFGPILTVMGVYKYRSHIFNIVCSKRNLYEKELVYVKQPYKKTINIISNENIKAIFLFKLLLKKLSQPENSVNGLRRNLTQKIDQLVNDSKKKFTVSLAFPLPTTNFNNPFNHTKQETQQDSNNFYEQFLIHKKKIREIIEKIVCLLKKSEQIRGKKEIDSNQIKVKDEGSEQIENQLMDNQGEIKMMEIIKKMVEFKLIIKLHNIQFNIEQMVPELIDPTSRLHSALKSVVSRYLLTKNPLLFQVYLFLKESQTFEQQIISHSSNGWYLKFILLKNKIIEGENFNLLQSLNNVKSSIPIIKIHSPSDKILKPSKINREKENNIMNEGHFLSQIEINTDQLQKQLSIMKQLIKFLSAANTDSLLSHLQLLPFKLLASTIIADYQGLVSSPPSVFAPSVGESIHMNFFDIDSVQAFKKAENLNCMSLRSLVGIQIMNYGSSKNQQLPSWMKFSQQQSAIILYGTPNSQDVESFIIRIFDETGYIARQFEIEVQEQQCQQEDSSKKENGEEVSEEQNEGSWKKEGEVQIEDDVDSINEVPFEINQQDINARDLQKISYLQSKRLNTKFLRQSSVFAEEYSLNKNQISELLSPKCIITDRFSSEIISEEQIKMIQQGNSKSIEIPSLLTSFKEQFK